MTKLSSFLRLVFLLLTSDAIHSTSPSTCYPFVLRISSYAYGNASHVLSFVVPEFQNTHPCVTIVSDMDDTNDPVPSSNTLLASPPLSSSTDTDLSTVIVLDYMEIVNKSKEAYDVRYDLSTNRMEITAYGKLGVAYVLHNLREHLILFPTQCTPSNDISSSTALPNGTIRPSPSLSTLLQHFPSSPSPVFSVRTVSEEGQLLDLPDFSYYTTDYQHFNTSLLIDETQLLEYEVIPAILRLRMNTLTILHSDIEDYVTYDTLQQYIPNAPVIYGPSDPHRTRRSELVAVMAAWVAHITNDYGVAVYFQPYEFSSPPGMCGTPFFNCTLGSPDIGNILKARYTEFFTAIPACAGIVATVTDSWSPRANYTFVTLWTNTAQLAETATLFYDAVVNTAQKDLIFRLWTLGQTVDWPTLRDNSPPGIEFSVKQTEGDFLLDYPINNLLNSTAPSEKRFMVLVDAFRQYNGWTSSVCYMGSQWQPRLNTAAINGAKDLNVWISWAPGCTWANAGSSLGNYSFNTDGYKSWRGYWNSYRMYNGTATNGGFSLNGYANSYLSYRLAWNTTVDSLSIAADFGTLYFGAVNSPYIVTILNASFYAWYQTSVPEAIGDFTLFWTMMSHAYASTWDHLVASGITADQCASAGNISSSYITIMENAFLSINPSAIPSTNPQGYTALQRAINISRDYLNAMFSWREAGMRNITLGSHPTADQCNTTLAVVQRAQTAIETFGSSYPLEDANWAVNTLGSELYIAPTFLTDTQYRTMSGWIQPWYNQIAAVCK